MNSIRLLMERPSNSDRDFTLLYMVSSKRRPV
nr:MAG TPA: hypothetical protein [Caudoviricetes sp.]